MDKQRSNAFMLKVVADVATTLAATLSIVGDRIGLFRAMGGAGPVTEPDLAERAGIAPRHAGELVATASAGAHMDAYGLPSPLAADRMLGRSNAAPQVEPRAIEAFISYAHKDEPLRQALDDHLALLQSRHLIDAWHDRRIQPGGDWAMTIDSNLSRARLILLLVTPAFFASGYCQSVELKRALERQRDDEASVIPVIMKEGDYIGAPFSHLKELPTDGLARGRSVTGKKWKNRDEALRDVTEGIRKSLEALQARRVVNQTDHIYREKAGHPPSAEDRAEISRIVESFGRVVAGRHVLWVDDRPENNATEMATLKELGVHVSTSTSTEDALSRLHAGAFHLVISDWVRQSANSPATHGEEGLRLLETMRGQALHQPVIFYTGWTTAQELHSSVTRAATAGATGVTASPRELLRWCVGELLRSAALDPKAAFVDIPLYGDFP